MNAIIETREPTKRFGDIIAVDGVSMTVDEQEIFGLIGPHGAGKDLLIPSGLDGDQLHREVEHEIIRIFRRQNNGPR